jgi:prepilin-type N-terminal cleavage/methylation domain-containing protein
MGSATPNIRARIRRALRLSDGFTLMEVMMAMALTVVIMASAGSLLYTGQKSATADAENATAQAEAQGQLDRMVRDLRQATDVTTLNAGQITVTLLDGTQLSYKCDAPDQGADASTYNACYRLTAAAAPAALPSPSASNRVIPRLIKQSSSSYSSPSTPIFSYTPTVIDDSNDSGDETADTVAGPPSPAYVSVHVELPASGELASVNNGSAGRNRSIVLDTGFEMRNVRYGLSGGAGS